MRVTDGRAVGASLVVLGILSLVEGVRLHALRTEMVAGAVVGDDTFPLTVGVALLVLGVAGGVLGRRPSVKVVPADGPARARMLWAAALLAAYWLVLPYVGYTGSTALVSTGLFRAMGQYRWPVSVLCGAVTTALLYLLFRVWLLQPLPAGWLGS